MPDLAAIPVGRSTSWATAWTIRCFTRVAERLLRRGDSVKSRGDLRSWRPLEYGIMARGRKTAAYIQESHWLLSATVTGATSSLPHGPAVTVYYCRVSPGAGEPSADAAKYQE
ncbi:hypothetical protein VFPBJ_11285 [Purpureocillium lilacinum]|uniref:Uncharacterized protein n=1 Tax=Purpureocillium lilacinum TaxID=33203 RepID=A0A179FED1_PURLI|nr:hypothetical protein VFPBJ_11285 [Purpureocillium lilacinum]